MATVNVKLKDLAAMIGAEPDRQIPQIKKAVYEGCLQSLPHLVKASPVDTGQYAASWDFTVTENAAIIGNFAPHAAIIENGARPFSPPIKPLLEWAKRVLNDSSQPPNYSPEVRRLAYGVRAKIQENGMMPKKILEKEMPNIINRIKKEFIKIA